MLNGRFNNKAAFTSVSTKGMAVVDYAIVPCHSFVRCSNFVVNDVVESVQKYNIAVDSSIPDHSMLTWEMEIFTGEPCEHMVSENKGSRVIKIMPEDYFESKEVILELQELRIKLQCLQCNQKPTTYSISTCQFVP